MSLILEALRKSELERRLGQAPGLMTPMPSERRRRQSNWLVVGTGVLAIALLISSLFWWVARDEPRAPQDIIDSDSGTATTHLAPPESSPVPGSVAVSAPTPAGAREAIDATAVVDAATKPTPKPPTNASPDLRAAPAPRDAEFESVERESIVVPARETPPDAPLIDPSAASAPTLSLPSIATPVEMSTSTQEVPPDDLLRLHQLPTSERNALPPLKLSMHVYNESPGSRFVLIDGHRYAEGEKITANLQVVEIQRNGIVLDFNGRRFLLQRP